MKLAGGSLGVNRVKKIFVGGLPAGTEDKDVEAYFLQYGKVSITVPVFAGRNSTLGFLQVVDVDLKMDKSTNRMRGLLADIVM